jgi:hypothetical protein
MSINIDLPEEHEIIKESINQLLEIQSLMNFEASEQFSKAFKIGFLECYYYLKNEHNIK